MKKLIFSFLLISLFVATTAQAQLRRDLSSPDDFTGQIVNPSSPTVQNGLERFFNSIEMSHSYSMSFGSYGGHYQNVNAYTNTMQFALTENLHGRVDVSFLHSPFGGDLYAGQQGGFKNQVIIENAELNYKISDRAFIHVQYNQLPASYGYGFNPYGYGYNQYYSPYRPYSSHFGYW